MFLKRKAATSHRLTKMYKQLFTCLGNRIMKYLCNNISRNRANAKISREFVLEGAAFAIKGSNRFVQVKVSFQRCYDLFVT